MNINELTVGQAKELSSMFGGNKEVSTPYDYLIGKNTIVRTVTMIYTGKLVSAHQQELVMVDVSWIPETERYMQFVADGAVRECEPYPQDMPVIIGRGAILDVVELRKPLPRTQK
jgi:hypothetical protein